MHEQMADRPDQEVTRRRVFYIPGYDPIHPRRYRELYRKEAAAQGRISGYEVALIGRQGGGTYGWQVDGAIGGAEVEAEFDVLVWSDIVRGTMALNIAQTYGLMLRTAWIYITTGTLGRLMRLRKGPIIAALYPVGALILQAMIALAIALGVNKALIVGWAALVGPNGLWGGQISPAASVSLLLLGLFGALAGGLFSAALTLRWFRKKDAKTFVYYLMQDYGYSARLRGANPPELEARMAEFAAQIEQALRSDVDEVLVVGHSSGAHLGVSILADLIREDRLPETGPRLGFLTLGQVVPMVSFLPQAQRLRRDLHDLSRSTDLTWVDVTAPGDGCAFALCDPVAVTGVAPKDKRWPLVVSAAFTQTLSPARWKELRWRFFRLHFQYLCAFDRPGDYDYFQITAGPLSLAARYQDRAPSQSRKETAVSKFRDMSS